MTHDEDTHEPAEPTTDALTEVATLFEFDSASNVLALPDGRRVHIKKSTLATLKPTLDYLAVVVRKLYKVKSERAMAKFSTAGLFGNPGEVLALISDQLEPTYRLAVMYCDLTYEELVALDTDQGISVLYRIFEVNKRFFTTNVKTAMAQVGTSAGLSGLAQYVLKASESQS